VYSFEDADDYVYDVKWSPAHPAMFATVDGSGSLDIWNLNAETEVPVLKTNVSSAQQASSLSSSQGQASPALLSRALNKLQWSRDGKRIITGDSAGALHLMSLGEVLYCFVIAFGSTV
jgi:dynein intermediate chain